MRFFTYAVLFAITQNWALGAAAADDDDDDPQLPPCTIRSPTTRSFFDLNRITIQPPDPKKKTEKVPSYRARGFDYGANFTVNFCAPVVESIRDIEGVDRPLWKNTGAYYEKDGEFYSLGLNNSELVFRGRKLVLNYTGGSPCPGNDNRRKSAVFSLLCERDPTAPSAAVSFVASPDDCSYFFEARSFAACASVDVVEQTVGPSSVFGIIAAIAILVYLIGGIVYQRTVMHQRGWRQLPNYALWSGIASFIKDMFIILTSSCFRWIPGKRRGYNQLNGGMNGGMNGFGGRGRSSSGNDDENRLIDELDEEY